MEENFARYAEIAEKFDIKGKVKNISRYGEGHINRTLLIETDKKRYILQHMNTSVFKDPYKLMQNVCLVTEFLRNIGYETLNIVRTLKGETFLNGEHCYRMYDFIENTETYQQVTDAKLFERAGKAFGEFQKHLSGFDASQLCETIENFHNTPKRYQDFLNAVKENKSGRAGTCKQDIEFFIKRANTYSKITDGIKSGKIPLRVTHNDTKLNNVLMDSKTGEARAIIDLDTVMPGSMLYDFGDSIRFGASTAAEDEKDVNKVHFCPEYYNAYRNGFLSAVGDTVKQAELDLMPYSAYLMTAECGMRFLGDYINGDVYFATKYPEHNLVRARTHIKLVFEIEEYFNL